MIKFENPNGYIEITNAYFATLVGRAAQSCFGVTGMVNGSAYESIVSAIKSKATGEKFNQGVSVKSVDGHAAAHLRLLRCQHHCHCGQHHQQGALHGGGSHRPEGQHRQCVCGCTELTLEWENIT